MTKAVKDIATLALCGLVVGVLLGIIAAGAYATWMVRGDMANIGFGTIFAFAPWEIGYFGEPFRTALMVGGVVAAILTVAVPALGFRKELTSHGDARWAEPAELSRQGMTVHARVDPKKGGLIGPIFGKLGGPRSRKPFLTSQNSPKTPDAIPHSLIDGPSGAGKGAGIIIPTLLTYWGSVMVLDPKGENFEETARRRKAMGDKIYRFDPYAADGRTHRYNPLDYMAEAPRHERLKEAKRVAASLIIKHGKEENFLGGARDIFAATGILMVHRGTGTIAAIYDALTQPGGAFEILANLAEEADEAGIPEAAGLLRQYAGYEAKVLSSYMSVLFEGGLNLWADPTVRAATSATDFRVERMRQQGTSVYVTVSPGDLVPLAPLVRVLFQQAIGVISQRKPVLQKRRGFWGRLLGRPKRKPGALHEPFPVLFILDEFTSIGKLDILIDALRFLRGYAGRVMIVIQSIASVRKIYGRDGADELLGLCGFQVFMSPSDKETPEYISRSVGKFTRKSRSKQWTSNEFKSQYNERDEGSELIRPEQVRMIGKRKIIALIENCRPVFTDRATYFEDRVLKRISKGQTGDYPMPDVPLQLGPEPAPPPNYKFYEDVDPHGLAGTPAANTAANGLKSQDQAEPIDVPAASHQEVPQRSQTAVDEDHVTPVNGHPVNGAKVEADDEDDDDLPPEKERAYYRGLSHMTIEQSHLHDVILERIAASKAQNKPHEDSAPAIRPVNGTRGKIEDPSPERSVPVTPPTTGLRRPVDLQAVSKARSALEQSKDASQSRTGTDD